MARYSKAYKPQLLLVFVRQRTAWIVLGVIFVLVFALNVVFSLQTSGFSSDESYWHSRNIEAIRSGARPLFDDPLAWGGRQVTFSPLYEYLVTVLSLAFPLVTGIKVVNAFFASLLCIVVYLLAFRLTKNHVFSLFTSLLSAIVPVWVQETLNTLSPLALVVPLVGFLLYCLLRIHERSWLNAYIFFVAVVAFLHPLSLLFAASLVVYLVLQRIVRGNHDQYVVEASLFSVLLIVWAQLLLYKKLLFQHGTAVIWQNIPSELVSQIFGKITVLGAIGSFGVFPVLVGAYLTYKYVFRVSNKELSLVMSLGLASGFLLFFRLLKPIVGLVFLHLSTMILFSYGLLLLWNYLEQTRVSKWRSVILACCMLGVFLLAGWSAQSVLAENIHAFPVVEQQAMRWLGNNTAEKSTVAGLVDEGQRLNAVGRRKTFMDDFFLGRLDGDQRTRDLQRLFTTPIELEAVELADKYSVDYVYVSPAARKQFGKNMLSYLNESNCFIRVYKNSVEIYEKLQFCKLQVAR